MAYVVTEIPEVMCKARGEGNTDPHEPIQVTIDGEDKDLYTAETMRTNDETLGFVIKESVCKHCGEWFVLAADDVSGV